MNVLVLEPSFAGHRGLYVERIVQAGLERGHRIHLATTQAALDDPSADRLRSLASNRLHWVDMVVRSRPPLMDRLFRGQLRYATYAAFRDCYQSVATRSKIDMVFVPYGDYCLYTASILGSPFDGCRWACIVMRVGHHLAGIGACPPPNWGQSIAQASKKLLFDRLLRQSEFASAISIDETLAEHYRRLGSAAAHKVVWAPDPADLELREDKGTARARLGIDSKRFVVLAYGSLTARKGVDALIEAVSRDSVPARVSVLMVGRLDEEVRRYLGSSPHVAALAAAGRLTTAEGYATSEAEDRAFSACDAVWVGYRDHRYMSGVVVLAGQARKPVIGCDEGLIGHIIRETRSGITVDVSDLDSVANALCSLAADPAKCMAFGESGYARFRAHTSAEFARRVWSALEGPFSGL